MNSNIAYHESFHHIRIDMEQVRYKNILTFSYIDGQQVKYPFYINNATNYFIKITENGESFKVRPKKRNPFSWSNLTDNSHQIEVEIEGESMTYSLREKSEEFKPILIRGRQPRQQQVHQDHQQEALQAGEVPRQVEAPVGGVLGDI